MSNIEEARHLPIGQLLGRMQRHFRVALYQRAQQAGYEDIREAHMQVFGTLDWRGTRLTGLAARANMTLASMAELVDELARKGYLERRPDPADGRAKVIRLTRKGKRMMAQASRSVREIERAYAKVVGADRFEAMCESLQELLDAYDGRSKDGSPVAGGVTAARQAVANVRAGVVSQGRRHSS